jgi:hypothetical protein
VSDHAYAADARVDEAEHENERDETLQGDQKWVVDVLGVRESVHLNGDVLQWLVQLVLDDCARDEILQRQESLLGVACGNHTD